MKRIVICIFFISFSFYSFSQKDGKVVVSGIVTDIHEHPIFNVNISIIGSSKGTKTDKNGTFYLTVNQKSAVLKISHIGYYTKNKMLLEDVINDTLNTQIQLNQKINQLSPFEITEEKIALLYNKKFAPIYDYEFYEDKLLLLVKELKTRKLRLIGLNQEILAEEVVPDKCEDIYKDCFGNIHVRSVDSVYQLKIDLLKIDLIYSIGKEKFDAYLKPCVTEFNDVLIFKQEAQYNRFISYYYLDGNREVKYFRKIRNKVVEKDLARRNGFIKMLQGDKSISIMGEDGSKVKTARRIMREIHYLDNILNHAENSPLFVIDNSMYIFDHINDSCLIFDENLEFEKGISINYNNQKKWDKAVVVDETEGEVYAKFEKEGLCYLKKIDLSTGKIVNSYKLEKHIYPIKIKIKDNSAYYLCKDLFNNGDVSLFRQNLYE